MPPATHHKSWHFWVDRGGTFTDIVARSPDGALLTHKLLSKNPTQYTDAITAGIKHFVGEDVSCVEAVRVGTTIGTNALLERKGARTVFVTTGGFKDGVAIAYQNRPDIFALKIRKPEMLYERVLEAHERVTAAGEVLIALQVEPLRSRLQEIRKQGITSCAITLVHGYKHSRHEQQLAALAAEMGFEHVSVSHEVAPVIKFVSRADTTLVDAYLSPLLRQYLDDLGRNFPGARIAIMQSGGGLVAASEFRGKDSVLSGPAGGIVGAVKTAAQMGLDKIVTFDMGGTSTDVAHFKGEIERSFDTQVAGVRLRAPMITIHTVASGGGSILHFDGARLAVGPDSAGAFPGPACYRNGGPLTVTDCNVLLGRIQSDFFPAVFGPKGDQELDFAAVKQAFDNFVAQLPGRSTEEIAAGFLDIAVMHMAQAIKKISVQRGHDVTDYSLFCFGGAGGQHACMIADALGITRVVIHPLAGVLSALGMGLADIQVLKQASVEVPLTDAGIDRAREAAKSLESLAASELKVSAGTAGSTDSKFEPRAYLRYQDAEATLPIAFSDAKTMRAEFEAEHQLRYGFAAPGKPILVSWVTVEGTAAGHRLIAEPAGEAVQRMNEAGTESAEPVEPVREIRMYSRGKWHTAPLYERALLKAQALIAGPALIAEDTATTCVEAGWQARVGAHGELFLTGTGTGTGAAHSTGKRIALDKPDPVYLEVFNSLFMFIAEQMGETLQMTSRSVNIKERLDFSCAVFDGQGDLIANAPHMPVHLGSMSDSVKSLIAARGEEMRPGDAYVHNDPYDGGTHLPDITVISPCFDQSGTKRLFFVASRGHHADVGGITPGSMPAESRDVREEGVLLRHLKVLQDGRFDDSRLQSLFACQAHPPRNIDQNIADLKAQVAANNRGIQELWKAVSLYGQEVVELYMEFVQLNAEQSVRKALSVMKDGSYSCEMDDGSTICVDIKVEGSGDTCTATIDFTGTAPQRSNNLNAPLSVCRAAVVYVFRTLVDEAIPLNAGCLRPLKLIVPPGTMLNPSYPAAVVAGNVETSQVICDVLYGALGVMAASQGTMNNFTFGNQRYQYYETIAGGSGAGATFDGTDAVQTNMTNSRLTDPEVLETRFPVLLEEFSIRRGSGGKGRHRGGDGVVRRLRFMEPLTATILSNRRRIAPPGLAGGSDGGRGKNYVLRAGKGQVVLSATQSVEMQDGDVFVIETPGGAGYEPNSAEER
jgi:5-oxoprolinase (ATP-hydrolysing)